ncbi:MAG: MFS transporter [Anaerolineae bacterium]|nr:MFS transporter [Anaerolineae bacterium]
MNRSGKSNMALRVESLQRTLKPRRILSSWMPMGQDVQSQNVRRVLIDGIGVGIAAAAAPYLPVFLARLGADNFAVGLLTSMPALAGLIFAIPLGQFLARQKNIVPWYSRSRFFVILCYALTGLAPFLVPNQVVLGILLIWLFATVPQTIVNLGFTIVMGSVAGPEGRLYLMSRRWSTLGITTAIVVVFAGIALDRLPFPYNYQIVFIVLSLGGVLSFAFSSRIELPDQKMPPRPVERPSPLKNLKRLTEQLRGEPRFMRVISSQVVYRFGLAYAIPLFPLYYVRVLNASDEAIGLIVTVQGAVLLVAYYVWARVTKLRGVRFALLVTTLAVAFYPIILAFTTQIPAVIVLSGLAAIFAAGIDLIFFDIVVSSYPQQEAATFVGVQQETVYLVSFIAPFVATAVATAVSIPFSLVVAGLIRLAGFGMFVVFSRDESNLPNP